MASANLMTSILAMLTWVYGRGGASFTDIANKFQMTEKEVKKLIETAGNAHFGSGMPDEEIEFDWDAFYSDDYVQIRNIRGLDKYLTLTDDETIAFVLGLYYLSKIVPEDLSEDAAAAALKLLSTYDIELDLAKFVIVDHEDVANRRSDILEAIANLKGIAFEYVNASNVRSERKVMPLQLTQAAGHWIVEAREAGTGKLKNFRLDRMENLEVTEQVEIDAQAPDSKPESRQVQVVIDPKSQWATEGRAKITNYRGMRATYTVFNDRWMESNLLMLGDGILECEDPQVLENASKRARIAQKNRARIRPA